MYEMKAFGSESLVVKKLMRLEVAGVGIQGHHGTS
jgi:hypothetical protein